MFGGLRRFATGGAIALALFVVPMAVIAAVPVPVLSPLDDVVSPPNWIDTMLPFLQPLIVKALEGLLLAVGTIGAIYLKRWSTAHADAKVTQAVQALTDVWNGSAKDMASWVVARYLSGSHPDAGQLTLDHPLMDEAADKFPAAFPEAMKAEPAGGKAEIKDAIFGEVGKLLMGVAGATPAGAALSIAGPLLGNFFKRIPAKAKAAPAVAPGRRK